MKRLLLAGSILTAFVMILGAFAAQARTESKKIETATVEFTETVKLLDVMLKGEYVIVHDEDRMAKGEDCTYVSDASGKLIVSFHCSPVERPKTERFRMVVAKINAPYGLGEVKEIQFAGSTEAHQIP